MRKWGGGAGMQRSFSNDTESRKKAKVNGMNGTVRITYRLSDEEWLRTSGMRWNPGVFPTYYCFHGQVSFRIGDQEVLGTDHFDISVADLAVGLANIADELRTGAVGTFKFQQGDDMLEITFHVDPDSATVSHNLAPGQSWACRRGVLQKALVNFVVSFTDEAIAKIPDLFGWRGMETLRYFSTRQV
jgi:hypothetical protein